MYPSQTLTTELMRPPKAEKCLEKPVQTKQANAQTQARQPNKQKIAKLQGDARCPSSKKKLKHQQQQRQRQCRLKTT